MEIAQDFNTKNVINWFFIKYIFCVRFIDLPQFNIISNLKIIKIKKSGLL